VLLSHVRLIGLGPFDDQSISLTDEAGLPRRRVVLFGGEGVGKTALLAAIASTRPGHAVAQLDGRAHAAGRAPAPGPVPFAVTDWLLGDDDLLRPHPLRIVSPNVKLDEPEDALLLRRREQALFERRATEGGFVLISFSGARWFSRTPVLLTTPERTILRYDLRASASFDDATRADLTRETKQVISFLAIAAALAQKGEDGAGNLRLLSLERVLREVIDALLEDARIRYLGVEPVTLEPLFEVNGQRTVEFDDLPRSARHLVAVGVLTLRALAAAYPGRHAREAEGVVLVDDIDLHQDLRRSRPLPALLELALPRVQWIVTTSSPLFALGCDITEVLALRKSVSGRVELHEGREAVMH
jgi:hypothetical protein